MKVGVWIVCSIFFFVLSIMSSSVFASDCSMLQYNVDDAGRRLNQAADARNLSDAQDYARRAKSALEDATMSAEDCGCEDARAEFDSAATYARRARNASSPKEFVDSLNRAIRTFNSGLDALETCR